MAAGKIEGAKLLDNTIIVRFVMPRSESQTLQTDVEPTDVAEELGTQTDIIDEHTIGHVPDFSRVDWIRGILLQAESTQLLEILDLKSQETIKCELMSFLFQSKENLHTFADLVSEDVLSIREGEISLTAFGERIIEELVGT